MKLNVVSIKKTWNNNLGFLPVSVFVELCNPEDGGEEMSLSAIYKVIVELNVPDVIFSFQKPNYSNMHELSWLTSKLMAEQVYTTIVTNIQFILGLLCTRLVVITTIDEYRNIANVSSLAVLDEQDIIIMCEDNINKLKYCINKVKSEKVKAKLYFNSAILSQKDVLENGIIECTPLNLLELF